MHPYCVWLLRHVRPLLENTLDLCNSTILDDLANLNILTPMQVNRVKASRQNNEMTEVLLTCLERCPPEYQPLPKFVDAVRYVDPQLSGAIVEAFNSKQIKAKLRPLMGKGRCVRCLVIQYLDPEELRHELSEESLLGKSEFDLYYSPEFCAKSEADQITQIISAFTMLTPQHQACLYHCMAKRSDEIAGQVAKIKTLGALRRCACDPIVSMAEEAGAESSDVIAGPQRAAAGNERQLCKVNNMGAKLVTIICSGQWEEFQRYVKMARDDHKANRNVISVILSHEVLMRLFSGRGFSWSLLGEFESTVHDANCRGYLTLHFSAVKAVIYRSKGMYAESCGVISNALQQTQLISPNYAVAFLHVENGMNLLHKVNLFTGDPSFPSHEALSQAAESMRTANQIYHHCNLECRD